MQSQVAVCMALAKGTSIITEGIYDTRFRYCGELNRMGASIQVDTKVAVIDGVEKLHGCAVKACDLRAGAAMVIAGLASEGETVIEDVHYIERGYEDLIGKLKNLGADIEAVWFPDSTDGPSRITIAG
jgi:UDP-N-acetylglucosamine 1-carboxyvinyltransferase